MKDFKNKTIILIIIGVFLSAFAKDIYQMTKERIVMPAVNKETIEQNTENIAKLIDVHEKSDEMYEKAIAQDSTILRIVLSNSMSLSDLKKKCDLNSKEIQKIINPEIASIE